MTPDHRIGPDVRTGPGPSGASLWRRVTFQVLPTSPAAVREDARLATVFRDRWNLRAAVAMVGFTALVALTQSITGELTARHALRLALGVPLVLLVWWVLSRLDARWLTAWPIVLSVELIGLGVSAPAAATPLVGLQALGFLYLGLVAPPRTFWWVLPFACVAAWSIYDLAPLPAAVRLTIAVIIWISVAELPARLLESLADQQRELGRLATTDPLTGLGNRLHMQDDLDRLDVTRRPHGAGTALALIDLDHFKAFNDAHGHVAGDEALAAFGRLVAATVRDGDRAYRYGGEEFLLVLHSTSPTDASALVDRLRRAWAATGTTLTFSAGVAVTLRDADRRLYEAKASGRDTTID